jgi:hypothetical protein
MAGTSPAMTPEKWFNMTALYLSPRGRVEKFTF